MLFQLHASYYLSDNVICSLFLLMWYHGFNPNKAGLFERSFLWGDGFNLKYVESEKVLASLVSLQQRNVKKSKKSMKIDENS